MRTLSILTIACVLIAGALFANESAACTIATAVQGETVLFGGNEDQLPNDAFLVADRSGKYGVVYFATPWDAWPLIMQMGINEKGLCYDTNYIPKERLTSQAGRKRLRVWVVQKLMREVATVKEVIARMNDYYWGRQMSYQVHMADRTGDAIVIHPTGDGDVSYTRIAPDKGFLVSTNINAGRYETGDGYCRRNEAAKQILATLNTGAELSVDLMVSVLRATSADQRYKTLYSAVYDLPEQRIHLYVQRQFLQPIVFDVAQELAKVVHPKQYRIVPLEDVVVEARSTGK